MKLSMHEHFVLLAIAILFEFNKVASSRRRSRSNVKCADNIFNTGNVNCGGHIAKTCSLCPCNQQGVYETYHGLGWCNGDCQWSNGACHMRRKINKGEWYSRDITIQGSWGGRGLGSVDLHMGI